VNDPISSYDSNRSTARAGNFVVTGGTRSTPSGGGDLVSSDRIFGNGAETQNKPNWMSATYSSAKVVIDVVKESSDVFPPLKSVASGLAAILKHYEVWPLSSFQSTTLIIPLASNNQ